MLGSINLSDKTYEEILTEAIERIPMYTDEWTNHNLSDPGITILQNLSAFTLLQRDIINDVSDAVRRRLLALLGFDAGEYESAEVYLQADGALSLNAGEKLMAEDVCFETEDATDAGAWGVTALYCERDGEVRDITYIQESNTNAGAAVFGAPAARGASFYVFFDDIPDDLNELLLEVRIIDSEKRNPFADEDSRFAGLQWQFFTAGGWRDVVSDDETRGFLVSGLVRLSLLGQDKATFALGGFDGFAVRCVLLRERYDIAPRLHSVTANLFKARQRDSRVRTLSFSGREPADLTDRIALNGYYQVLCDEDGSGVFRMYSLWPGPAAGASGRYFSLEPIADGLRLRFNKRRFGFGPKPREDAVRVICYGEQTVEHLTLGRVLGYEGQEFAIEGASRILAKGFCLLAEYRDESDTPAFVFVRPAEEDGRALRYRVVSDAGLVLVEDPGDLEGCVLHLADLAVTEGNQGNIRAGNRFVPLLFTENERNAIPRITNPLPASGGRMRESTEHIRRRFLSEMNTPSVAVTAQDYEEIVRGTPGLCIHKVKAVADPAKNLVRIAIKPHSEHERPKLSSFYRQHIVKYVDRHRTIGTLVEFLSPAYVPIDVRAVVYTKGFFTDARSEIEGFLREALDGASGEAPFGARISFTGLYRQLSSLDCVNEIYEFSMSPRDKMNAGMDGGDIILGDGALYYAGSFTLEIR
ncbi:MAG: baseplate J/gp47 family protein [Clostridiales Family XIII bacterium]|jgi:hypothetical protein|nr:baseplate J/gp47 family protein [Clostridiales Family XIII bacterium]